MKRFLAISLICLSAFSLVGCGEELVEEDGVSIPKKSYISEEGTIVISAEDLVNEFREDIDAATEKYKGKEIEAVGFVDSFRDFYVIMPIDGFDPAGNKGKGRIRDLECEVDGAEIFDMGQTDQRLVSVRGTFEEVYDHSTHESIRLRSGDIKEF